MPIGIEGNDDREERHLLKMGAQAMRNGWEIPDDVKQLLLNKAALIIAESNKPRSVVAAARVILEADRINIERERIHAVQKHEVSQKVSGGGVMVVPARLAEDQWEQAAAQVKTEAIEERQRQDRNEERNRDVTDTEH